MEKQEKRRQCRHQNFYKQIIIARRRHRWKMTQEDSKLQHFVLAFVKSIKLMWESGNDTWRNLRLSRQLWYYQPMSIISRDWEHHQPPHLCGASVQDLILPLLKIIIVKVNKIKKLKIKEVQKKNILPCWFNILAPYPLQVWNLSSRPWRGDE